jgi:hypothetical protein
LDSQSQLKNQNKLDDRKRAISSDVHGSILSTSEKKLHISAITADSKKQFQEETANSTVGS